jgi:hypothetical protein
MSTLRIVDDTIEMDQRAVATLVPGLQLSLRDQLIAIFDAANEDAEYILELEDRLAQLKAKKFLLEGAIVRLPRGRADRRPAQRRTDHRAGSMNERSPRAGRITG